MWMNFKGIVDRFKRFALYDSICIISGKGKNIDTEIRTLVAKLGLGVRGWWQRGMRQLVKADCSVLCLDCGTGYTITRICQAHKTIK